MEYPLHFERDAEGTVRTNALHWEGFPCLLWESLSAVGFTTPPTYEVTEYWLQGAPCARAVVTVPPHPGFPEWPDLGTVIVAHREMEAVEAAALRVLHVFCEQHPHVVMLTPLGLFPARDPEDLAWQERVGLLDALLTANPPEETVRTLLRFLEATYNLTVARYSSEGLLTLVILEAAAGREAMAIQLEQQQQVINGMQQQIIHLQDQLIQGHMHQGQQFLHFQHENDLLRTQMAQIEEERFALVQNVAEMQNQILDAEIEVEVWQAFAQKQQQAPPPVVLEVLGELQGHSGLDEMSVASLQTPQSSEGSVGSTA